MIRCFDGLCLSVAFVSIQESYMPSDDDQDIDEPSPEALARYLAMRRHTVGPGNENVGKQLRKKMAGHATKDQPPGAHPSYQLATTPEEPPLNLSSMSRRFFSLFGREQALPSAYVVKS